ncbi:MAG: amidohydrolase family protein [Prevotella sp.]|nr:amidohydrolase family protein [Prevotella sp.]MBQ8702685.1 amidohydrolase family protein [Prevotella sp.]
MQIFRANIIFTPESSRFEVVPRGYIAVSDEGKVIGIYRDFPADENISHIPAPPHSRIPEIIDLGDRLLIPAMNDMHVHAPQYRNQGIAMDEELLPWLQNYTFPEELKYADLEYAQRMYRRFVRDLWRFGTMRVVAFASVHLESTRLLIRLLNEAGLAGLVGKVNMNRNCPEGLQETPDEALRACDVLMEEFGDSRVSPIVTPRFIPSCTPEMLRACGEMVSKYNLPVQSHLSENLGEIAWVGELEPESRHYADAYDRYGLLGTPAPPRPRTIMAHCVWTDGDELDMLRRKGVMVAHCPTSNLNLASGMAPIRRFLDAGVAVGLGSDLSGGHDLSIFRMMVYAVQVSKMHYQRERQSSHLAPRPFLSLSEAFWIATKSAGRFFGRVGSFEPGYDFDALVIDDSSLLLDNDYTLLERLERFVYLGDDRHIAARYCQGRLIPEPFAK